MNWFEISNPDAVPSPALLLFRDRIESNLATMLRTAGNPDRLRPHIKTHKLPELVRRQVELGLTKCKCATIAEAELAAANGVADMLLAYQPVGPGVHRLVELTRRHPGTRFACLVDDAAAASALAQRQADDRQGESLRVFLDLDVGQQRTGIRPEAAAALARFVATLPQLRLAGLHAYDGHLHDSDPLVRAERCGESMAPVWQLKAALEAEGIPVPTVVVGGSPTFPIHAQRPDVELSPGTTVLWDAGYAHKLPDLPFLPAAVLLTRVVSKPGTNRLCLDLGHKAVASEMPHPRAVFLNLPDAVPVMHSEEHLVVETPNAAAVPVGTVVYALPWHVCPTVALHEEVFVVEDHRAVARWQVTARRRRLEV